MAHVDPFAPGDSPLHPANFAAAVRRDEPPAPPAPDPEPAPDPDPEPATPKKTRRRRASTTTKAAPDAGAAQQPAKDLDAALAALDAAKGDT